MTEEKLHTQFNLGPQSDDVYAELVAAHDGLSEEESRRLDARLVLILANHVGDPDVLREAIAAARRSLEDGAD